MTTACRMFTRAEISASSTDFDERDIQNGCVVPGSGLTFCSTDSFAMSLAGICRPARGGVAE